MKKPINFIAPCYVDKRRLVLTIETEEQNLNDYKNNLPTKYEIVLDHWEDKEIRELKVNDKSAKSRLKVVSFYKHNCQAYIEEVGLNQATLFIDRRYPHQCERVCDVYYDGEVYAVPLLNL